MARARVFILAALICLLMLAGGCAHNASEALPRLLWPPPPAEPRLELLGTYTPALPSYRPNGWEAGSGSRSLIREIPVDLVSDGKGTLYLTEKDKRNIVVHHPDSGEFGLLFKQAPLASPYGLALGDDGLLYLSDSVKGQILVSTTQGNPLHTFQDRDHLTLPTHLAVSSRLNRIFVSDERRDQVVAFDRRGTYLFSIGGHGAGPGEFSRPRGLALDRHDRLHVADAENSRVQVFDVDGHHLAILGGKGSTVPLQGPADIAFDSEGHLYVVDEKKNALFIFSAEGSLLLAVGSGTPSSHSMGFSHPSAIDIDVHDRIYIADCFNGRYSIWQYLSPAYLRQHPVTEEEREALRRYIAASRPKAAAEQTSESPVCFWGLCFDTAPLKAASPSTRQQPAAARP